MTFARLASLLVLAATAALSIAACRPCTLVGCVSGFELTLKPPTDQPRLTAGIYEIALLVDEGRFELHCEVGENTTCDEGRWTVEPTRDVFVNGRQFMPFEQDGFGDAIGMWVFINDGDDTLGPEIVEVSVARDGVEVVAERYEPEYSRTEDFNGPGCGACDSLEEAELVVPGPAARE